MENPQPPKEIANPFTAILEELAEIKKMFKEAFAVEEKPTFSEDQLLDTESAAKLLSLSVPSIYRLSANNELPHFKKGRKLRFYKNELLAWINDGRRETTLDIEGSGKLTPK